MPADVSEYASNQHNFSSPSWPYRVFMAPVLFPALVQIASIPFFLALREERN
jgi:hypothetical protein